MRSPSSPAVIALALLFLADPRTAGAALLDPTRPLGGGREETASAKSQEALALAAAVPIEPASAPAAPPALQSLQVPRQGEATAIVDGQLLKVGGKLGSYEVTHIDAHGLMVRGPAGRERWTLAGVEVLDSRQPAASLKLGPLDEPRKPARRSAAANAGLPLPPLAPQGGAGASLSPLVFPLPLPQGQAAPASRVLPPTPAPELTAPPPSNPPARPAAVKQAQAQPPIQSLSGMAPMKMAWQPAPPQPRPTVRPKRGASAEQAWTASPSKPLRMDLDDMRRIVQVLPQTAPSADKVGSASRWQRPVGPNPLGVWVAAWSTSPSPVQRSSEASATAGLMLARWMPPQQPNRRQAIKLAAVRYAPVPGPRPMPASVVWRANTSPTVWQPQGVHELPGAHSSQWASRAKPLLRIAALEPQAVVPRTFARAAASPSPRVWAGPRWTPAQPTVTAKVVPPVTHAYPMALPQWRSAPTAEADNSSLTQVALALETP